mmetsp:Transcript_2870/g.2698  ORF Transcript_2870/g.2698 Transcript_2870/m.2698 type:complete len:80 (+) Transcript_2870:1754-1993(+)
MTKFRSDNKTLPLNGDTSVDNNRINTSILYGSCQKNMFKRQDEQQNESYRRHRTHKRGSTSILNENINFGRYNDITVQS